MRTRKRAYIDLVLSDKDIRRLRKGYVVDLHSNGSHYSLRARDGAEMRYISRLRSLQARLKDLRAQLHEVSK